MGMPRITYHDASDRIGHLLERSAPRHPPCFEGREQWVQWLRVAESSNDKLVRPLMYRAAKDGAAKPTAFNVQVNFCADCTAGYQTEMKLQERCEPECLQKQAVAAC